MSGRHGYDEHGDWDALATAYALHALEPDEEARFLPHLRTCARCAETLREATRTVGDLAYAVPDEEPPPALKQRLMAEVAASPRGRVPPRGGTEAGEHGLGQPVPRPLAPPPSRVGGAGPAGPAGPAGDTVVPFRPRTRRWQRIAAAAAAVVALAGLGAWNAKLRSDQHRLSDIAAQREKTIEQLTRSGPARIAALERDGRRVATVVVRPGAVEMINEALRPNAADETYWLWAVPDSGAAVPLAGFEVRSDQVSAQTLRPISSGQDQAPKFAVSIEQSGVTPVEPSGVFAAGNATG
jgi:anti-sigma-K factor RskA